MHNTNRSNKCRKTRFSHKGLILINASRFLIVQYLYTPLSPPVVTNCFFETQSSENKTVKYQAGSQKKLIIYLLNLLLWRFSLVWRNNFVLNI